MRVPVVGIDLDGVLVEFNLAMLEILTGITGVEYTPEEVVNYDYSKCLEGVTPEIVSQAFDLAINSNGYWVHLTSTSLEAVEAAKDLSYFSHLYAVTARAENGEAESKYQTTLDQSSYWLTTRGIMCAGVIVCGSATDKGYVTSALRCEYFLDDQPRSWISCMDSGINAYLLDATYNQDVDTDRRVYSVREFVDMVKEETK